MWIDIKNDPTSVFDKHYSLKCPHCGNFSNLSAISVPRYEYLARFKPSKVGVVYRCDSCNSPVFLKFNVQKYALESHKISISEGYKEVEQAQESFEYKYLPDTVSEDFKEALKCYSIGCYNAFASMCRRTIQSAFTELGSSGKDRVHAQLIDMKETANLDDETYKMLEQIVIYGHDGAHPHLPKLSSDRAKVLLELMKDVLYQLFVRRAKIQESVNLRKKGIEDSKDGSEEIQGA